MAERSLPFHSRDTPESCGAHLAAGQEPQQPLLTIKQSRCPILPGNLSSDPEHPRSPSLPRDQHLAPARLLSRSLTASPRQGTQHGPPNHRPVCDHTGGRQNRDSACCLSSPAFNLAQLQKRHGFPAHQTQLPTCP